MRHSLLVLALLLIAGTAQARARPARQPPPLALVGCVSCLLDRRAGGPFVSGRPGWAGGPGWPCGPGGARRTGGAGGTYSPGSARGSGGTTSSASARSTGRARAARGARAGTGAACAARTAGRALGSAAAAGATGDAAGAGRARTRRCLSTSTRVVGFYGTRRATGGVQNRPKQKNAGFHLVSCSRARPKTFNYAAPPRGFALNVSFRLRR